MANAYGKIIANVDRLHRLMDDEGLSAVVARSGKNFTYLAGFAYPGTLARHLEFPRLAPGSPVGVAAERGAGDGPQLLRRAIGAPRLLARKDRNLRRLRRIALRKGGPGAAGPGSGRGDHRRRKRATSTPTGGRRFWACCRRPGSSIQPT